MSEPKRMDPAEFRRLGYLQELNRRLLHPLGLAMAVKVEDDGTTTLECIYDARQDPEGWVFSYQPGGWPDADDASREHQERAAWIDAEWERRRPAREALLGYMVQPPDSRGPVRQADQRPLCIDVGAGTRSDDRCVDPERCRMWDYCLQEPNPPQGSEEA